MTAYQFDSILVADPVTFQRAINATVTVYDVADTGNTTPLPLKDLNGLPLPNPLTSNADAFLPPFTTTSPHVKLVAGTLALAQASYEALLDEARAAKEFVSGISVAATQTAEPGSPANVTIDESGQFTFTIPRGDTGAAGDKGDPGVWSPEFQAQQQGFWPIYSDAPPAKTEMYGVPVLWLKPTGLLTDIPQVPVQPLWDNAKQQFMIPSGIVGVIYKDAVSGQVLTQGTVIPAPTPLPSKVNIKAEALPGYTSSAPFSWQHWFANPALSTLVASDGFTGSDGTGLNGRTLDNTLGGNKTLKWVQSSSGTDTIVLAGNQAKNTTAFNNGYDVETGALNHRIEFDMIGFSWTGSDNDYPFVVSVGGAASIFLGQNRLRLDYGNEAGGGRDLIFGLNRKTPLGTYQLEIFEYQVGIKIPDESSMRYFDVTYVDKFTGVPGSKRTSKLRVSNIMSSETRGWTMDNLKIYSLGGF